VQRLVAWFAALSVLISTAASGAGLVVSGEIHGAIGPASASYLTRVLDAGRRAEAELIVVSIDTPGGLDTAMREMIQAILASPVPVALFVAPRGARAASAGTYLLYASHVAAMAPGTNVGAATPVAIGIGGRESPGEDKGAEDDKKPPKSGRDTMEAKAMRDAAAYLRSLAEMRGRNAEWAQKAVVESDSLSASEALKLKVIDVIATDVPDLLRQLNGRSVEVPGGKRTLALSGAGVRAIELNWKEGLLTVIANPNIALLLLMAGVYGLLIEFYVPGTALPGVVGAISLLLGLYGLALLPINVAGAALLVLGVALMVGEIFLPSFGALGIGGVAAFVAGGFLLIDAEVPGFTVSWRLLLPLAAANVAVIIGVGAFAMRARRRPSVAGAEAMVGASAEALEDFERDGWVRAHGERWRARTAVPLKRGETARIAHVDGLVLELEPSTRQGEGR
jgi:membrane-bound serine protease (ClpP class)